MVASAGLCVLGGYRVYQTWKNPEAPLLVQMTGYAGAIETAHRDLSANAKKIEQLAPFRPWMYRTPVSGVLTSAVRAIRATGMNVAWRSFEFKQGAFTLKIELIIPAEASNNLPVFETFSNRLAQATGAFSSVTPEWVTLDTRADKSKSLAVTISGQAGWASPQAPAMTIPPALEKAWEIVQQHRENLRKREHDMSGDGLRPTYQAELERRLETAVTTATVIEIREKARALLALARAGRLDDFAPILRDAVAVLKSPEQDISGELQKLLTAWEGETGPRLTWKNKQADRLRKKLNQLDQLIRNMPDAEKTRVVGEQVAAIFSQAAGWPRHQDVLIERKHEQAAAGLIDSFSSPEKVAITFEGALESAGPLFAWQKWRLSRAEGARETPAASTESAGSISVQAENTYAFDDVVRFLRAMEAAPYLFLIDDAKFGFSGTWSGITGPEFNGRFPVFEGAKLDELAGGGS